MLPETPPSPHLSCPIPTLRSGDSGPRARFLECDVGNLEPRREGHHRFRPDQILKRLARESFSHIVSNVLARD